MTVSFAVDRLEKKLEIDYRDVEFWTVIRHPEKRLLSSVNYHYKQTRNFLPAHTNIDNYLDMVRNSRYWEGTVYRSQSSWLDRDDIDVRLWPLEHYDDMLRQLGWDQPLPQENKSPKTWTMDDLRLSKHYDVFMAKYDDDWRLYQKALDKFPESP